MVLNGFVKAIFDGYRKAKAYNHNPLNELENSWKLLEVDDLNDLYKKAKTKEQHDLDHMYQYDATRAGYYKRIEKKIIEHYWEG